MTSGISSSVTMKSVPATGGLLNTATFIFLLNSDVFNDTVSMAIAVSSVSAARGVDKEKA